MANDLRVGGTLEHVTLDRLEPDALNPRLPPSVQRQHLDPDELYPYLDKAYDVVSIAQSIARHGYFESEPLVAVKIADAYTDRKSARGDTRLVVVEGNRRLTALKGLADLDLRAKLPSAGWLHLPKDVQLPPAITVLVVKSRENAAPILGFRHITRPAPWEPYPQAKYIAGLIDDQGRTFAEVADLLDRGESEVRSYYRNYWLLEQAEDVFRLADLERVTDSFGVFTRAMQSPDLRAYIGAPDPKDVDPDLWPLPDTVADRLETLVTWLFGTPRTGAHEDARPPRPGQVLLDSRQITQLGRALQNPRSERALEDGLSLDEALETLIDPLDALLRGLRAARKVLLRAQDDLAEANGLIGGLLGEIEAALKTYEERAIAGPSA